MTSQEDDETATFAPKGFTKVVIEGDTNPEIIIHDVTLTKDLEPQARAVAPVLSHALTPAPTTTNSTDTTTTLPTKAPKPSTPDSYTEQSLGQIQIEIGGVKISADALLSNGQVV